MPGFTKGVWTHKVHSIHMTLRLLNSICFEDLNHIKDIINRTSFFYVIRKTFRVIKGHVI